MDRAERVEGLSAEPSRPRPAATVALLRDVDDGVQTYMLRRPATMAFAPGAYVFPGGAVDPGDALLGPGMIRHDPLSGSWRASALAGPVVRELVTAAVRETFEETGVLLARPRASARLPSGPAHWRHVREQLLCSATDLASVLDEHELVLDTSLLVPWARLVTPDHLPIRFDTVFFVAVLPAGQSPRRTRAESSYARWISPADALARHDQGRLPLMRPTRALLGALAPFRSTAAVMRDLRWLDADPPWLTATAGGREPPADRLLTGAVRPTDVPSQG